MKLFTYLCAALWLSACATHSSDSVSQKRQAILEMRQDVLNQLYQTKPDVRGQINAAPGYAVFNNANVNLILASFGGGYGVVQNNQNGQRTYMNMGEVGLGLGLGLKDFRLVMVFHTQAALNRFVEHGWSFGGQADAAAKAGSKGGAIAAEARIDDVTVYSLTESGLALQAVLKGTKFWLDPELN